jgi:hypothetical protein
MEIEQAIYNLLSGDATIAALVGTKISPVKKKQDSDLPAITFRRVTTGRFPAMSVDASVVKARFQVDCWAGTYPVAVQLKNAVKAVMKRWRTTTGITVQDTFMDGEIDFYEEDTKQFHIAIDFEINYNEA